MAVHRRRMPPPPPPGPSSLLLHPLMRGTDPGTGCTGWSRHAKRDIHKQKIKKIIVSTFPGQKEIFLNINCFSAPQNIRILQLLVLDRSCVCRGIGPKGGDSHAPPSPPSPQETSLRTALLKSNLGTAPAGAPALAPRPSFTPFRHYPRSGTTASLASGHSGEGDTADFTPQFATFGLAPAPGAPPGPLSPTRAVPRLSTEPHLRGPPRMVPSPRHSLQSPPRQAFAGLSTEPPNPRPAPSRQRKAWGSEAGTAFDAGAIPMQDASPSSRDSLSRESRGGAQALHRAQSQQVMSSPSRGRDRDRGRGGAQSPMSGSRTSSVASPSRVRVAYSMLDADLAASPTAPPERPPWAQPPPPPQVLVPPMGLDQFTPSTPTWMQGPLVRREAERPGSSPARRPPSRPDQSPPRQTTM